VKPRDSNLESPGHEALMRCCPAEKFATRTEAVALDSVCTQVVRTIRKPEAAGRLGGPCPESELCCKVTVWSATGVCTCATKPLAKTTARIGIGWRFPESRMDQSIRAVYRIVAGMGQVLKNQTAQ